MTLGRLGRARGVAWGVAALIAACGGGSGDPIVGGQVEAGAAPPSSVSPEGGTTSSGGDASAPSAGNGDQEAGAIEAGSVEGGSTCTAAFPSVTDFGAPGPFAITKEDGTTVPSLGTASCTVYRPTILGQGGVQHPIIVWGNGTGTPTVIVYEWLFNQWASHGFIVAAANTPSAGTGKEMLTCLDWVEGQSTLMGSAYEGHVSLGRSGASGHSQGGGGAIMVGRDPRIVVTVPFMAYTQGLGHDPASDSHQQGPMLLMSGGADTIAPPDTNQKPVFASSNVPTFWGVLAGADHVSFALGGIKGYLAPSTAWFRLNLMCDESARPMFYGTSCTLCTGSTWTVQKKGMP